MQYIFIIILTLLSIILLYKLQEKQIINKKELEEYRNELNEIQHKVNNVKRQLEFSQKELDQSIDRTKKEIEHQQQLKNIIFSQIEEQINEQKNNATKELVDWLDLEKSKTIEALTTQQELVASEKLELDRQLRIAQDHYRSITSHLEALQSDEFEDLNSLLIDKLDAQDIDYLLHNVQNHIINKTIIPKFIWTFYLKNSFDNLCVRSNITNNSGIYKITNKINKKAYIGKATKLKNRLSQHIKGAIGMTTVSDQEVHRIMNEEGIENFTYEVILECPKEQLGQHEKYYIDFFNTVEQGYNVRAGG